MFQKIIFNSPWYYFLLSFLLSLLCVLFLYYRNKRNSDASGTVLILLSTARFISTFLIVLLLLNILFRRVQNATENPLIILAVDNSTSIVSGADSGFVKSGFLPQLEELRTELENKYTVKTLLFDEKVQNHQSPDHQGKETDIDHLFSEIDNNYSNQNIGTVILFTDGIYNKGSNPLYATEKFNFPIYTVALGDTQTVKDISIHKVNHNEVVYSGNFFPVEVVIRVRGYKGKELSVSLTGGNGQPAKKTIQVNTDDFIGTSSFSLEASSPGVIRYLAQVSTALDEKNTTNNSRPFVVEVIDNREKILLIGNAPHPDMSAIKEALGKNENYEIEHVRDRAEVGALKGYGLVILHGFRSSQSAALVNECRSNKVPYWIIAPADPAALPGLRISGTGNRLNDAESVLNPNFTLFSSSDELRRLLAELPAVKTFFGNYEISNGVSSLITQRIGAVETENPLLYFHESDELKSAVFAGDGLWRWKMRNFAQNKNHELFTELISKTVQYLAVKNDKSFFRIAAPRIIAENEAFELTAEFYNKSYELTTEPEITLTLTNGQGKKFNYTFSKLSRTYQLNVGMLPPGEYRYEAKTKGNNQLYVKQGMLVVKEVVSEKMNTVANHQLLYQLASRSGGKMFYPQEIQNLMKEISNSETIKPVTYSQSITTGLIDLKWLFFLILLTLAVEWYFRKRYLII